MRLWVTTHVEEKITRNIAVPYKSHHDIKTFTVTLCDVCNALDIPSPLITQTFYDALCNFNSVKFKPRDFVESVDFEYLMCEVIE